jgi:Flp pilus assembly protein TadG
VVVALLMVPLIAFAALGLDLSALWWQKQQLRTGAEAGALAIAQDCGRGACGTPAGTAQSLATANSRGAVTASVLAASGGRVTVRTVATRQHLFAPVVGVRSSALRVQVDAAYGAPSGGTAVLPLTFSWCEFAAQTGGGLPSAATERVIHFTKTSGVQGCTGPSGNVVPGGFGWLTVNAGSCQTRSALGQTLWSDPGASVPSGCSTASFASAQNQVVLLPLFDQAGDGGSGAWYHVYGYAAFRVTGYHFVGQYSWNGGSTCKGDDRCLKGYFTRFVSLDDAFTSSAAAPALGASVVTLTS